MSGKVPAFSPMDQNVMIVRITSYENRRPQGSLTGPGLDGPLAFTSLAQLLLEMEALMDQTNRPQRGEEHRVFTPSGRRASPEAGGAGKGQDELATFQIRVLFRQNSSWQGILIWTDQKMDAQFRSALELIRLMDSALMAGEEDP